MHADGIFPVVSRPYCESGSLLTNLDCLIGASAGIDNMRAPSGGSG